MTKQNALFNFDKAVRELRANLKTYGATREHKSIARQIQWPYFEALKNPKLELFEQEALLSKLKITKIEWSSVDTITTMRFGFNNGTASP